MPDCPFCATRCQVHRVLPDGSWSGPMATCPRGAAADLDRLGYTHHHAIDPAADRAGAAHARARALLAEIDRFTERVHAAGPDGLAQRAHDRCAAIDHDLAALVPDMLPPAPPRCWYCRAVITDPWNSPTAPPVCSGCGDPAGHRRDDAVNGGAAFLAQTTADQRPALAVADVLIFGYVEHGVLQVSIDGPATEPSTVPGAGPSTGPSAGPGRAAGRAGGAGRLLGVRVDVGDRTVYRSGLATLPAGATGAAPAPPAAVAELQRRITGLGPTQLAAVLEDVVLDVAAAHGTNALNDGEPVEFLLLHGWTPAQITAAIDADPGAAANDASPRAGACGG